ncbi:hypothetical protein [Aureimonas altamirensis]|uniref:hypothetical protein n=1 Tax=Aureimonas altamirensis TaxID=370622 RepID=UPI003015AE1F
MANRRIARGIEIHLPNNPSDDELVRAILHPDADPFSDIYRVRPIVGDGWSSDGEYLPGKDLIDVQARTARLAVLAKTRLPEIGWSPEAIEKVITLKCQPAFHRNEYIRFVNVDMALFYSEFVEETEMSNKASDDKGGANYDWN